jgi:type I restriction enzyme R subunit
LRDERASEAAGSYGGKVIEAGDGEVASLLGQLACDVEAIIRRHAVVRWRDNADAQNRMRNDLDDLLFQLQSRNGVKLTYAQMDSIIEAILRIARNRGDV